MQNILKEKRNEIKISKKVMYLFLLSIFLINSLSTGKNQLTLNNSFPLRNVKSADPILAVAVSVVPQIEWLEEIGGEFVEIMSLIPPGQSPASYEPTSRELTFVSDADAWFQIGLTDFDRVNEQAILESAKFTQDQIYNLSEGLDLLYLAEHTHEDDHEIESEDLNPIGLDPHIWLSPTRVIQMSEIIRDALISLDPSHASEYTMRAAQYVQKLEHLNSSINQSFENTTNKNMLVFHPAWGYFCSDYGLNLIALEEEGKDPSSAHFMEVIDYVNEQQIGVIFIQEEFSESVAEAFAREAGVEIFRLYPLAANYSVNLNWTAQILGEKLDQPPNPVSGTIAGYSEYGMLIFTGVFLLIIMKKRIHKIWGEI